MIVVVPYVAGMLHPDTGAAVRGSGLGSMFCDVDRGDPQGYARLICRLWRARATFVLCEQDVVPTRDQLAELAHCGHDWCVHEYDDGLSPGSPKLGLARFSARLLCDQPGLAERALRIPQSGDQYRPWSECDVRLVRELGFVGETPYLHEPPVRHLRGVA